MRPNTLSPYGLFTFASGLLALFVSVDMAAADLNDVNIIVDKANRAAFYAGDDGRAETRMTIVDAQKRRQLRQFTILRRDISDAGDQQFMVLFSRPSDVRRTVFRVEKHVDRDDDRWLYLPGLDLVKRIAAGDKRTSFVGSHFYYEDVSGRNPAEDIHELIDTTEQHYVVRNIPKDKNTVEFAQYTVWIDKQNFMPVKTEYRDDAGNIYRRVEALAIENIQGHATATKMRVSDLNSGGYTINEMRFIKYDLGVPADVFSERSLRNPPREWFTTGRK